MLLSEEWEETRMTGTVDLDAARLKNDNHKNGHLELILGPLFLLIGSFDLIDTLYGIGYRFREI